MIYLKDFASEPQFRETSFLLEALKNDRIDEILLNHLSKIYKKMCDR